ncbi:hypothetical protein H7J83_10145 [Mycobacterium mantenii]|uniref:hypothetical protein n=1 Tax=Mycobacterium mantenii TaxID=560555 RepID=UPI0021F38527|nr:hypothetical protein [Mycobacterium mantenii]MCV7243102.1 hypothetical protein [Mycobacterium mantenii]
MVWPVNRNQISDSGSVACVAWVVVVAAALTVELVAGCANDCNALVVLVAVELVVALVTAAAWVA